jgi:hypothetical protein
MGAFTEKVDVLFSEQGLVPLKAQFAARDGMDEPWVGATIRGKPLRTAMGIVILLQVPARSRI